MKYFSARFYYVRYNILSRIVYYTYRKFDLRVWLSSLVFIILYFINQLVHIFFRLIDEVFFSRYRSVRITQPVFIIANPRSGTTYLHRLMSMDGERFTYTKFAHTFFMTVSFTRIADGVKWIDHHTGNWIRKLLDRLDDTFWGGWDNIHAMGFNKAEEDELPFAQALMSTGIFLPFPYFDRIHGNKFLDREPASVRRGMMDFYESCVKRFVYASGPDKTYLSKNVMSTGRFKSLLERFPDAKVIYIARHPYEVVPSCTSMFTSMYGSSVANDDPARLAWAELSIQYFLYLAEMRSEIPASQFIAVKYDDLIDRPKDTVLNIYRHFGWQASDVMIQKLDAEDARHKDYHSAHEYSLDKFGLSKEYIYERLFDIFHEFGFEK